MQAAEEEKGRRLQEAERQKRLQLDTSRKLFAAARKVTQQEEIGKEARSLRVGVTPITTPITPPITPTTTPTTPITTIHR